MSDNVVQIKPAAVAVTPPVPVLVKLTRDECRQLAVKSRADELWHQEQIRVLKFFAAQPNYPKSSFKNVFPGMIARLEKMKDAANHSRFDKTQSGQSPAPAYGDGDYWFTYEEFSYLFLWGQRVRQHLFTLVREGVSLNISREKIIQWHTNLSHTDRTLIGVKTYKFAENHWHKYIAIFEVIQ